MGESRSLLKSAAFPLFLLALTFALYREAFGVFFSLDDLLFLQAADGVAEFPRGLRRVLSVRGFFTACWHLFGDRAQLYHLVILSLHAGSGLLLALIGRRLGLREIAAAAVATAFVVSPVAFTCLHWISGVQEVGLAFFSFLAVLFLLQNRTVYDGAALGVFVIALLCKEAGFLLLPVLALILPMTRRRRWLVGVGSLVLGILVLVLAGALEQRPKGNPYETVYGANVLWNFLTYTAWIVRPWQYFPDQVPEFQPALWRWGLALPALLALVVWRRRDWAPAIGKCALLFFILLLPVLPLLRHSYYYYLYLPMAPLYLLAVLGIERLPRRAGRAVFALPLLLLLIAGWQGEKRRGDHLRDGMLLDPMLRYAEMAGEAVASFRSAPVPVKGDVLVTVPFLGESVDLAKGLRRTANMRNVRFLPVQKALRDGDAILLFFPEMKSVQFVYDIDEETRWEDRQIFMLTGTADFNYLGVGEAARYELSRIFFRYRDYARAQREVELLLARNPANSNLVYDLAIAGIAQGDQPLLERAAARLDSMARAESAPRAASENLRKLAETLERMRQQQGQKN